MAVKVIGAKKLEARFKKLARSIENRRPLFKRIGVKLLNEISKNFALESHEGVPWKPLSPLTLSRRRTGPGAGTAKILQDTGTLRRSFVSNPSNRRVIVGTPIEYAVPHEEGKNNIPQRKMLPSKKRGLEIAIDTTNKYIRSNIRRSRLFR